MAHLVVEETMEGKDNKRDGKGGLVLVEVVVVGRLA